MYRAFGDESELIFSQPLPQRDTSAAKPPSAEAIIAYASAGGCTQTLPSDSQGPCLDATWVPLIASCKFNLGAPPGVSAKTWGTFCNKAKQCHWEDFPGCLSFDAALGPTVPACLEGKTKTFIDYCDEHPFFDGGIRENDIYCWAASKAPTWVYNAHAAPPCSGSSAAGMTSGTKLALFGAAAAAGLYFLTRRR